MRRWASSLPRNPWVYLAGYVGVVVLDQLSKALIVTSLSDGATMGHLSGEVAYPVVGDFLRIAPVYNTGALFRLLLPFLNPTLGYGILFAVVSLLLARHGLARPAPTIRWGIVLALGGATGNLVDRIGFGQVVDFLSLGVPGIAWRSPTFNFADVAICSGAALLAWGEYRPSESIAVPTRGCPTRDPNGVRSS